MEFDASVNGTLDIEIENLLAEVSDTEQEDDVTDLSDEVCNDANCEDNVRRNVYYCIRIMSFQ